MAPQKSQAVPTAANDWDPTVFKIPSKKRKPIPIVKPSSEDEGAMSPSLKLTDVNKAGLSSRQSTSAVTDKGLAASTSTLYDADAWPRLESVRSAQAQKPPLYKSHTGVEQGTKNLVINDSLDVFAPNYIPRWLLAVNSSHAYVRPCKPFPSIDFKSYIATFVGPDFAKEVQPANMASLVTVPDMDLSPYNYMSTWSRHLNTEVSLEQEQHHTFGLYNQTLLVESGRNGYYRLRVPGLLENAPRIDLGDIVHVRLLLEYGPSAKPQEKDIDLWLWNGKQTGKVCPGFSGYRYDTYVWEINRAKEFITLRMDDFPRSGRGNVIFLPQEAKIEPMYRAVQTYFDSYSWLGKMLFPGSTECGVQQLKLSSAHFDIPWVDQLNWEQKKAVHSVVSANYGTMPYLIWGPPGTGKTKTLVETAVQLLRKPGHILICAPSDAAADTLALRLSVHLAPGELFRLNHWRRTFAEVPDGLMLYTYANETSFSLPPVDQMLKYRVVVTTCRDADLLNRARLTNVSLSGLFRGVAHMLSLEPPQHQLHWTCLLLDEAAQATEPETLIPLTVVMPPNGVEQQPQFVAAGDQYQLGPKLLSKSSLAISLFQRLFDTKPYHDHPLSRKHGTRVITKQMLPMPRPPFTNLIRNYRSHPAILSIPSTLFYNDTLIPERKTSQAILTWPGWRSKHHWPVLFKQITSEDAYESITDGSGTGSGTLYNPGEATTTLKLVLSLLQHSNNNSSTKQIQLRQKDIMIMSPFRKQVSHLRTTFRQSNLFEVNIGPLEAFQGLESRIVIICTTRTRVGNTATQPASHHVTVDKSRGLGVIDEPQRLNVAMTRAQEGLIVVGNAHCLVSTRDNQWMNFIDFCRRNECYDVPADFVWPDLGGPYPQGRLERALVYAALGRAEAEAEAEAGAEAAERGGRSDLANASTSRFSLRGTRQEMDEEMWQFKELAQLHDSEAVDVLLEQNEDESSFNGNEDSSIEGENENTRDDDYDRNLIQELHRECNTQ